MQPTDDSQSVTRTRLSAGLDRAVVAEPVRVPRASRILERARAAATANADAQRVRLQRSQARGLLLLALLALLVSLARAGVGRVFYAGWWRQW